MKQCRLCEVAVFHSVNLVDRGLQQQKAALGLVVKYSLANTEYGECA